MRPRAVIGFGIVVAFLAALTLASAPRLHDQLHPAGPNHECAVTIIAAGNCEQATPPQVAPEMHNVPPSPAFLSQRLQFVVAAVPSSILEHAPPASH